MSSRKQTISALVNYSGSAFSVIGALLTIYFAVFYVPEYIRSAEKERILSAHNELITTLQEVAFNNHNVSADQVRAQIRAAEMKFNITYPYNPEELIAQVQESFMSTRFLPFKQRAELAAQLDSIRKDLKGATIESIEKVEAYHFNWLSIFTALVGTVFAIIGLISSFLRLKKERETTIEEEVKSKVEDIEYEVKTGFDYEKLISDVLLDLKISHEVCSQRRAIAADFIVNANNKTYLMEAKYFLNRQIDSSIIARITAVALREPYPLVLVTNSQLSNAAKDFVKNYNISNPDTQIKVVFAKNRIELTNEFKMLFASGT
ncbi:MAG: hypothetical protein LUQ65_00240 [Candidatus Helarchaeota archaeon]|nr:hypothetical protein [Candidatus Helarchaeota archaeon]